MPTVYKSLKVPAWVYDNALLLRSDVVRCGVGVVPRRIVAPKLCPRCLKKLPPTIVDSVTCSCGYRVQALDGAGEQLGLGVLLGLGLASLAERLEVPHAAATDSRRRRRSERGT